MAKKRSVKRRKPKKQGQKPSSGKWIISAPTLFRFTLIEETRDLVEAKLSKFKPLLWLRDRKNVKQIEQAGTADELLDLVFLASGLAESTWQDRMRQLGPEVIPLTAARLKSSGQIRGRERRDMVVEKYIAALRWRGEAGGQVLLDCFEALNAYGRSLACVVLGLLEMPAGADKIWTYYQKVVRNRSESYFVGALWGLIDLRDERAGQALAELLTKRRYFYELFGFLALAGDAQAVNPLLQLLAEVPEENQLDPLMALLSIGHRLGREGLLAELERIGSPEETPAEREAAVEAILSKPADYAKNHFQLFYRGLSAEDLAELNDYPEGNL